MTNGRPIRGKLRGVTPVELFDIRVANSTFETELQRHGADRALNAFLQEYSFDGKLQLPSICADPLNAVYLAGGGSKTLDVSAAANFGVSLHKIENIDFPADLGGTHLLRLHGLTGPVIDIGQTSTKLTLRSHRLQFPRDMELHPIASAPVDTSEKDARLLAKTISQQLHLLSTSERWTGLCLSLPCEVSLLGDLSWCSYRGIYENSPFIEELTSLVGLQVGSAIVSNDAETAGMSCLLSSHAAIAHSLLITFGHSVGGALICTK